MAAGEDFSRFTGAACLALAAVLVAFAAAWAGSASATALCREAATEGGDCVLPYGAETEILAEAKEAVFQGGAFKVVCPKSTATVKTTEVATEEGKSLSMSFTGLTFSECKLNGETACTATANSLPYTSSLAWTSGSNGSLAVTSPSGLVKCSFECTFKASSVTLDFTGGTTATIAAKEETLEKASGSILCPKTVKWSATYTLVEPVEAFVTPDPEPATVLCFNKEDPCNNAWGLPRALSFNLLQPPGSTFEWKGKVQNTCTTSTMDGKAETPGAPLVGKLEKMSFTNCDNCTVAFDRLPYRADIYAIGKDSGSVILSSGGKGKPRLELKCAKETCESIVQLAFPMGIAGGDPAVAVFKNAEFPESKGGCGTIKWSAQYEVTTPKPVWIEH